jgi:hypothetical protein
MDPFSKLTDSSLPLIIFAAIAGVRIITMIRRRVKKRAADATKEETPPTKPRGFRPFALETAEEQARQPAQSDPDDDDEEEFSAWSLSINDEPPPAAPSKPVVAKADSIFTALSSTSAVPISGEVPAWLQPPVRSAELSASAAETRVSEPGAAGGGEPANRSVPAAGAGSRRRSLPPLQQAVIWAEILGTPKGLRS